MRAPVGTILRLLLATLVTGVVLSAAYLNAVLHSTMAGRWGTSWWWVSAGVVIALWICVRGLFRASRVAAVAGLACGVASWGAGMWYWGASYLGGDVPLWIVGGGFFLSSLWILWLGWMPSVGWSWRARWQLLLALALPPAAFCAAFTAGELSGDAQLQFHWRWARGAPAGPVPAVHPENGVVNESMNGVDFFQFQGPNRDGRLSEPKLNRDWTGHPPALVWRIPVGPAWSSFALVDRLAITQEQRGESEAVVAYDLSTGVERWAYTYPAQFGGSGSGPGPRATPTVVGGRVYALGATGLLHALELNSGAKIWSRDARGDSGSALQLHGASASPLVVDDMVLACPSGESGATLAAYRQSDGSPVWTSGEKSPAYSSPMLVDLLGERAILQIDGSGFNVFGVADGALRLRYAWNVGQDNVAQPIVGAGTANGVLLTSGESDGTVLLELSHGKLGEWQARRVWSGRVMKTKFSTAVLWQGHVYGLDNGILSCVDVRDGRAIWKKGRYKHGQLLLVSGLLLVLSEDGELVLIDPQPSGLVELGRIACLEGKTWSPPALRGNLLVVRNASMAACYRLSVEKGDDHASISRTTSP